MFLVRRSAAAGAPALGAGTGVAADVELEDLDTRTPGTATCGDTIWALATPLSDSSELKRIAIGNTSPAHEGFKPHGIVLHPDRDGIDEEEVA